MKNNNKLIHYRDDDKSLQNHREPEDGYFMPETALYDLAVTEMTIVNGRRLTSPGSKQ